MTERPRVLVIEDEPDIAEMVTRFLSSHGFVSASAGNTLEAEQLLETFLPDIVLLDWMLPGRSGFDFCKGLRANARTRDLPVIMLTARDEERDRIQALDCGADDYVTKPFSLGELASRLRAVLRRTSRGHARSAVTLDGLSIDPETRRITADGHSLTVGPTEFELLHFLMTHAERVHSRGELLQHVWNGKGFVEDRTVDVHIGRLRKALAPTGHDRLIQTVRAAGYRLSSQP